MVRPPEVPLDEPPQVGQVLDDLGPVEPPFADDGGPDLGRVGPVADQDVHGVARREQQGHVRGGGGGPQDGQPGAEPFDHVSIRTSYADAGVPEAGSNPSPRTLFLAAIWSAGT